MKILCIIAFSFVLVGCTSSRQSSSLTAEQAKALAMRLANDKASTDYHCQPFRDGRPAHFTAGYWVWTDREAYGHGDIEARVELAPDGSPHTVELRLLDSRALF